VPFAWYQGFLEAGTWTVDLGDGPAEHTFAETISAWLADDAFLTDAPVRRGRLAALREAMRGADDAMDPAFVDALAEQVRAVFGDETTMIRVRSSSNAEDSLYFSAAGLYDSFSGCLADDLDSDDLGPSLCDDEEDGEMPLSLAIRSTWSSLWNMEAFDERAWYGIDHASCAMGLLVNDRTDDERANAVLFTGNPTTDGDDRWLVNSQYGDLDVVAADPGVVPEKVLLTVDDGEVVEILRVAASSEVPPGEYVLDDLELGELGADGWEVLTLFPLDDEPPEGHEILLDTEWKLLRAGRFIVKQVRPYLR
jgi:hypothetical protein